MASTLLAMSSTPYTYVTATSRYKLRPTQCKSPVIENTHSAAPDVVAPDSLHQPVHNQQRNIKRGNICTEDFESWYKTCFTLSVKDHDTCYISTSVAVIWCTPDCDEVLIEMVFVSFHDELMCSCNQREIIYMVELHQNTPKNGGMYL
jgi:hypothetical protein